MSAEAFRVLVEAITAQPVAIVPRCSDCGRACNVAMASPDGAVRYCADCIDFGIAARMKAARDEARRTSGNSYRASARNAEQADEKIGERTK